MTRATISKTKNRLLALLEFVKRGEEVLILDRLGPAPRARADILAALLAEREEGR